SDALFIVVVILVGFADIPRRIWVLERKKPPEGRLELYYIVLRACSNTY
ncbi:hypothetical protein GGE09_004778, partial [Roseobacter sp. N2S]|nr:hypothetical protein [Roseobacter sp. N2S]